MSKTSHRDRLKRHRGLEFIRKDYERDGAAILADYQREVAETDDPYVAWLRFDARLGLRSQQAMALMKARAARDGF